MLRADLVITAYNSGGDLLKLAESAVSSRHEVRIRVILHSDHADTVRACGVLEGRKSTRIDDHRVNRGLARSWNDGLIDGYSHGSDVVLLCNDDVLFSPGDVDRLVDAASTASDRYVVTCAGTDRRLGRRVDSHGYACFAINPVALESVGCFDENFFPIYYEDLDYERRAALLGLRTAGCPDTNVYHAGSATISRDQALYSRNEASRTLNAAYYGLKWGGQPGSERFVKPFDDDKYGLTIRSSDRSCPYGQRDRPARNFYGATTLEGSI